MENILRRKFTFEVGLALKVIEVEKKSNIKKKKGVLLKYLRVVIQKM